MKIGNIYKFDNNINLILNYYLMNDVYKITYKNLTQGIIKTEMFQKNFFNSKEQLILSYIIETKYHYKFKNNNGIDYEFEKQNVNDVIENLINNKWPNKKLLPVFINYYEGNIIKGTKIKLISNETKDIFYSINNEEFKKYKEEIIINDDCVLKTYASLENYENSDISEYKFKLKNRTLKIYFSPSRQINNKGIDPNIYPSEMEMMNLLTTKIINNLKYKDVICYRNDPDLFIKDWLIDGIDKDIDIHFALHSNATFMHNKKGPELWIDNYKSKTYSFANILYDNLYSIYYDNTNSITNRGVKEANGSLMECNDKYFKYGLLLETAYHDNLSDSKWISENIDEIAENITESLTNYFQLK